MNVDEVLAHAKAAVSAVDHKVLFMNGSIEADHDGSLFRLYPDPADRRSYYVLKRADAVGDLHEFSQEEMVQAGFVGAKLFRVALRASCEVQAVSVIVHRLGETIAAWGMGRRLKPAYAGECEATSGCNSGCCTYASNGKCYCDHCCIA